MAIAIGSYNSDTAGVKLPKKFHLDGRMEYDTIADMAKVKDAQMPEMLMGFCLEDHKIYLFNKQNEKDDTLGKWREFSVEAPSYEHLQESPNKKWRISHNLDKQYPNVIAVDPDGEQIVGSISYNTPNDLVITFCKAVAGSAYIT